MRRTSITAPDDLLDEFDRKRSLQIAEGELPPGTTRTHVVRALIRGYVEGNLRCRPETSTPTTMLTVNAR